MSSHFSTIGMPIQNQEELISLAQRVMGTCTTIRVTNGTYLQWSSPSGAELWLQFDNHNRLIGINPHFTGQARILVGLIGIISRPNMSALDGSFYAWADPKNTEPDSGIYPFVFDVPDINRHKQLTLPVTVKAQVAAFAHEVSLYETEEFFHDSQTDEIKLATRSFIPSELFSPGGKRPPEATAIFTGIVQRVRLEVNELTNKKFWWVLVDSLGGSFDVVIDPELIDSKPEVGGVLSGSFWLSGRIVNM